MAMNLLFWMPRTKQLNTVSLCFFLVVKTNVNYQVAGSFVLQSETSHAITEALEVIKGWNNGWKPAYFMVDYSEEEMSAINRIFPS